MSQLSGNSSDRSISEGYGVPLEKIESLQESIMAIKQENVYATPEKSYEDMDCVKIEVATNDVAVEKPAGMLERMR